MRTVSDAIRSKLPIFEIMRAHRLCAELSRASHRGPRRLGVYVLGLALTVRLCVPSDVSRAAGPTPEARPAYFAVLGEVASPGVYELPTGCTLGQLVRSAGGITRDADGNARVFRGARLAERLFVASSESSMLYPGDLILIDRRATGQSASKVSSNSEVQIGFLNLIDRPVVMKMPGDQASLARIVEFLRQPPELVEQVQIVGPSRKNVRRSADPQRDAVLLTSGTVLIFPKRSVRLASVPPLPDPIAPAKSRPLNGGLLAHSEESTRRSGTHAPGPDPSRDASGRTDPNLPALGSRLSGSRFRNVAPRDWESQRLRDEEHSHARSNVFFFVLAGTAALVMMLTLSSMGSRWINEVRSRDSDRPSTLLPAPPTLSPLAGVNRPIRVDTNQPQTRLGIDLAVFERVKARHTQGTCSDPTPKAA
jgi:SLBB domain